MAEVNAEVVIKILQDRIRDLEWQLTLYQAKEVMDNQEKDKKNG